MSEIMLRICALESEAKTLKAAARELEDRADRLDEEAGNARREVEEVEDEYGKIDDKVIAGEDLQAEVVNKATELRRLSDELWNVSLKPWLPEPCVIYYRKLSDALRGHSRDLEDLADEQ